MTETATTPSFTLLFAQYLAELGFRVFPCKPNGKEPACYWQQEATTDLTQISNWFSECPNMNYGVVMGDGYFALDLDCKAHGRGVDQLFDLEILNGDVPETFTVKTPSGGEHRYFRGSAPSSVGKKELGDSIDVRGEGGYVVGPGSVINGKPYEVEVDALIAPAPKWLLERAGRRNIEPKRHDPSVPLDVPHVVESVRKYLVGLVEQGDVAIEHCGGNNRTYRLFCKLLDFVSPEAAYSLVAEIWNPACKPSWPGDELAKILANAVRYRQNDVGALAGKSSPDALNNAPPPLIGNAPSLSPDADGARHIGGLTYYLADDIQAEKIEWVWPNRFAKGMIGMIAGYPDQGKSLITASIAATVSIGGKWPFNEGTAEKGAVIILSAEDHKAQVIKPRLMAAGADTDQCLIVEATVKNDGGVRMLNLADDLDRIGGLINFERSRGRDVRLMIIDPISAYVGGKTKGDSFKNAEMRALLTPLSKWAEERKIAVICVSHFTKGGNSHALYRVTDSLAFTAACRTVSLTAKEKDDDGNDTGRNLFLKGKNNLTSDPGGLAYKFETMTVDIGRGGTISAPRIVWDGIVAVTAEEALAEHAGKVSKVEKAKDFLLTILANGPVAVTKIHELAEGKHAWITIKRAKAQLGIVTKRVGGLADEGQWQWALPGAEEDPDEALLRAPSS